MQLLESKIQEAKSKKDTLKARAQSAKYEITDLVFIYLALLAPILSQVDDCSLCSVHEPSFNHEFITFV